MFGPDNLSCLYIDPILASISLVELGQANPGVNCEALPIGEEVCLKGIE